MLRCVSTRQWVSDAVPVTAAQTAPRTVAVDIGDADLDADVRAVVAALALTVHPRDGGAADVLLTDRPVADPTAGASAVIRVAGDGAEGPGDEVVRLPSGTARLIELLSAPAGAPSGRLVAVVGAVGGCGVSTLAAALAVRAASTTRTLLVECDPGGPGIDLLLGMESEPGLRVDDVRSVLGGPDPDALWAAVPVAGPGCGVLARSRSGGRSTLDPVGAGESDSGAGAALAHRRGGGLAVCDVGGLVDSSPVLARADHLVVVTRADLPGAVTAARAGRYRDRVSLVVRAQRGDPLDATEIAESAGFPRWHPCPELRAVRRLTGAGEFGRVLGRGHAGRLRRLAALADRLLGEVGLDEY